MLNRPPRCSSWYLHSRSASLSFARFDRTTLLPFLPGIDLAAWTNFVFFSILAFIVLSPSTRMSTRQRALEYAFEWFANRVCVIWELCQLAPRSLQQLLFCPWSCYVWSGFDQALLNRPDRLQAEFDVHSEAHLIRSSKITCWLKVKSAADMIRRWFTWLITSIATSQ